MRVTTLPTPQVLVDHNRLKSNIGEMQRRAASGGKRLRPHAKTHKIPAVVRMQIDAGAVGICCAKVGEAEVFAAAGCADIRLAYPVHPLNASRVAALQDRARVSIIVDDLDVASGWSDAMSAMRRRLDVLVKVDVGFHRCGIDPDSREAPAMLERVGALPGLELRGVLSHAGHAYGARGERELREIACRERDWLTSLASRAGLDGAEISVGATPTARFSVALDGITELRPGNYVYFDRTQVGLESARASDCALTVLARVVSRPAEDRVILDCGSKTLSSDGARGFSPGPGFGAVLEDLEADAVDTQLVIERLSEEHATLRVEGRSALRPGDLVRVLPNHSCVVSNLVDYLQVVDGLEVVDTWRVDARGKIN